MSHKSLIAIAGSMLPILACALIGYLLGRAEAPTAAEWRGEYLTSQVNARKAATAEAIAESTPRGRQKGFGVGRRRGAHLGIQKGAQAGHTAADELIAELEEELAALEYDPQLPNGDPGYILPEEERSVACIGVSAATGECVGD